MAKVEGARAAAGGAETWAVTTGAAAIRVAKMVGKAGKGVTGVVGRVGTVVANSVAVVV